MTLAFYMVDNSQGYTRNTFNGFNPTEIKEKLSKLSDDELKMYDLNNEDDKVYFQEDINDKEFDYGWWCVVVG